MIMGIGDCRHHAQVKQILFDCWQAEKVNKKINDAFQAETRSTTLVDDVTSLLSTELVTMDVELHAPVEMIGPYNAKKDAQGNYLPSKDDQPDKVEEHTLNVLLERDTDNNIQQITLKDAFYQNEYSFTDLTLDDSSTQSDLQRVHAGDYLSVAQQQGTTKVPIQLTPTAYAGKRDLYEPGTETAYFLNMPLNQAPDESFISPHTKRDLDVFYQKLSGTSE